MVPPPVLEAVAVNVTGVPEQIAPEGEAPMLTAGVMLELTDMVIVFELAVFALRQVPPVIVMVQVTASPFANELDVYVFELPVCALTLLTLKL